MRARWCLLAALAAVLSACGGSSGPGSSGVAGNDVGIDVPVAPGSAQTIRLAGVERGTGSVGVVLAHMLSSSQQAWSPFAAELAEEGFHVLTFDFRGHGGSGGDRNASLADLDLAGAIQKIRSLGATRVLVVGASMGGTAAIVVAASQDLGGVVALSAPTKIDDLDVAKAVPPMREPLLILVAEKDDPRYLNSARALLPSATQKRLQVIEDSSAHGTDLLTEPRAGARVKTLITDFLVDNRG